MQSTPELVAAVLRDRERDVERARLARIAARVRACCSPSTLTRFLRAVRPQPESC
jgi:hypothetical protein